MEVLTRVELLASVHPDASADLVPLQLLRLLHHRLFPGLSAQQQTNITIPPKLMGSLQVSTAGVDK